MSYCRFSTNDHQCDVYVYHSVSGAYVTHVASVRICYKEPLPPPAPYSDVAAWSERHDAMQRLFERATRMKIGLPHDGETYDDDTPGECADRLEVLQAIGYMVPQSVIDTLREDEDEREGGVS